MKRVTFGFVFEYDEEDFPGYDDEDFEDMAYRTLEGNLPDLAEGTVETIDEEMPEHVVNLQ